MTYGAVATESRRFRRRSLGNFRSALLEDGARDNAREDRGRALAPFVVVGRRLERGFPLLPSGCHLELDPVARDLVLENLKARVGRGLRQELGSELRDLVARTDEPVGLAAFLRETGRDLEEVYRDSVGGWMAVRREAGVLAEPPGNAEADLAAQLARLLHVDEPARLRLYRRLAQEGEGILPMLDEADRRRLTMLAFALVPTRRESITLAGSGNSERSPSGNSERSGGAVDAPRKTAAEDAIPRRRRGRGCKEC